MITGNNLLEVHVEGKCVAGNPLESLVSGKLKQGGD